MFMSMNNYDSHMNLGIPDYRLFNKAMQEAKRDALNGPTPKESRFTPYSFEGGTVGALAGDNWVVMGGDMRMSANGSVVQTRHCEKVFKLDGGIVLASTGFYGDLLQLVRVLRARMKVYQFTYNEPMGIQAASEMLSRTLYYKRFFPYYAANILGGIDEKGKGALYRYDPVGTIGRTDCDAQGAGMEILLTFLENQSDWRNKPDSTRPPRTIDMAKKLLRDGFRAVAERETSTGDAMYMITLQAGKPIEEEIVQLRAD